jgi:hypothetical protein
MGMLTFSDTALLVLDYTVTGAGGTSITIPALRGASIALLAYNTLVLIPETGPLDGSGYNFDSGTGTFNFGFPTNPGDVLQILYTQ